MQVGEQLRGGAEQDGVASQYGGVADVLGDHGLAQAIGANQDEVAGLGEEVQRKRPFDDIAFDARGPGPVEVGHGLELLDLGGAQAALETAVSALGNFDLRQMIEQLARRPALLGTRGPAYHPVARPRR